MSINKLIKALIFSSLTMIILLSLGTWQLERLRWKSHIISTMNKHISLSPKEINASVINDIKNYNYRRIKLEGTYIYNKNITIYSKVLNGKVGRHLIIPFKTKFGYILINKGFIPKDYNIDLAFAEKAKNISINGIVKFQQKINYFTPKNNLITNEWYYINLDEIGKFLNIPLMDFYLIEEDNPKERYPVGSQYNLKVPNDHLQYAITWFSLAIALSIFMHLLWRNNVN
jgi:surfeit locus 1 family protein